MRPGHKLVLLCLSLGGALAGLTVPLAQKQLIDRLQHGESGTVWWAALACVALLFSRSLALLIKMYGLREGAISVQWLATGLYSHALSLDERHRHRLTTGNLVALYTSHVQQISYFFEEILPLFFVAVIPILVGPLALKYFFGLPLTSVLITMSVSLAACALLAIRQSRLFYRDKQLDEQRLNVVNEWLQNIRNLRVLGWIETIETRLKERRQIGTNQRVRVVGNGTLMNSISTAVPALINCAGLYTIIHSSTHKLTPGEILATVWMLGVFLAGPIRSLPWVVVTWNDIRGSLFRLQDFFELPEENSEQVFSPNLHPAQAFASEYKISTSQDPEDVLQIERLNLRIEDKEILSDISFEIRRGSLTVIIGGVGAGKTAILSALLRDAPAVYETFCIAGKNGLSMTLNELRSYFGVVHQDNFTMNATIGENVRISYNSKPNEDDRSIWKSLDSAEMTKDLQLIEGNLETQIGERGVNLSGGQRQRLAMARAHFANREIILLDDSLSAVDVETEQLLIENLIHGEWKEKTRILVSHRHQILPLADQIIFIAGGRIVCRGNYQDLINKNQEFSSFIHKELKESCHTKMEEVDS